MKRIFKQIVVISLLAIVTSCAHDDSKDLNARLKSDTYEVSTQGGDESLLRGPVASEIQTTLSGVLKVRGVRQKFVGSLDLQLVDRDGSIYARTKSQEDGSFSMKGHLMPGKYYIKVIAKKFRGGLVVTVDQADLSNLVVPVQAIIR